MKAYKALVFFLFIVLLSSSVYGYKAAIKPVKDTVFFDEIAEFELEIDNRGISKDSIRVYSLHYPEWDLYTEPRTNPIIAAMDANEVRKIKIFFDPQYVDQAGQYILSLNLKSTVSQESLKLPVSIFVKSPYQQKGYIPTVIVDVDIPKSIDPRSKIPIKLHLNNQNILNITEMLITMHSKLINIDLEASIGPKEKKTIEVTASIDPATKPTADTLYISLLWQNKTIAGPVTKTLDIGKYEDIKQDETVKKRLFKTVKEITFANEGNTDFQGNLKADISMFNRMFTGSNPKGTVVKGDGGAYIAWEASLGAGQSTTYVVYESYRILVVILLLAGLAGVLYYFYRSPLILVKNVAEVHHKEGGISGLKVILHIRNRGKEKIQHIEVTDRIPNMTYIEKDITIGTLHPAKVLQHSHKTTLARWDIENIDSGDERVISYRLKAKLPILGGLVLPPAVGRCLVDGKHVVTYSNRLGVEKELPKNVE